MDVMCAWMICSARLIASFLIRLSSERLVVVLNFKRWERESNICRCQQYPFIIQHILFVWEVFVRFSFLCSSFQLLPPLLFAFFASLSLPFTCIVSIACLTFTHPAICCRQMAKKMSAQADLCVFCVWVSGCPFPLSTTFISSLTLVWTTRRVSEVSASRISSALVHNKTVKNIWAAKSEEKNLLRKEWKWKE